MTAKELYNWTVANNCENLPLITLNNYDDEYDGNAFGYVDNDNIEIHRDIPCGHEGVYLFPTDEVFWG